MRVLLVFLFFAVVAFGQNRATSEPAMPSQAEIPELLNKANEKVSSFEDAVKNARPYLDRINPKLVANYTDAAFTAHTIISGMQKNGTSAYGLVGLLATLDDLSLNASTASVQLLRTDEEHVAKGSPPDIGALSAVILLGSASTSCTDISELIMHATLRYVGAEENILGKLLDGQK